MHTDCKAIVRSHILCNLAIAPKLKPQLNHMQLCTSHNGAGRLMLQASLTWKTIYELHGIQNHAYQHQSWDTSKRKRMANQMSLLLEKMYIPLNQTHMFGSCNQIQDWSGREGYDLIHNSSKLSVTSYFKNMNSVKHLHVVYLVHCGPNFTHFMNNLTSDCGKAYFPAVIHKEDMTIDKENINSYANLLLELQ
jgi:hypothetical protein